MFKQKGFTLVEILVALVIFAILGVLAAASLHTMIRSHQKLKKADHQLLQLQMTMTLLRRDIAEMIDRPVRNREDLLAPALIGSTNRIVFTRTGLVNPFSLNRQSNMQRVGYAMQGDQLVRLTWDVLDLSPNSKAETQTLLSGVESIQFQFIADNGATTSTWPPTTGSSLQHESRSPLPKVILVVMHVRHEGILQGVFPIYARGN